MNKLMKLTILAILLFMFVPNMVKAEDKVNIYVFYGRDCPHCAKEKTFLASIKDEYNLNIMYYETWYNKTNLEIFEEVGKIFDENTTSVPFTIIGDKTFVGYSEFMDGEIRSAIRTYTKDNDELVALVQDAIADGTAGDNTTTNRYVVLGFFGAIVVAGVVMFLPKKKGV
jgi:glutaredoxin